MERYQRQIQLDNIGLEGQKYIDDTTVYGQVGYFDAEDDSNSDVMTNASFVRGVVRHFLKDDEMISAEISYVDGEENNNSADDMNGYSWAVRYQRGINGSLSGFVQYNGTNIEDQDDSQDVEEHTLMVGLRLNFYGHKTSLKSVDRHGATFDMPDVGRWTAWTMDVAE